MIGKRATMAANKINEQRGWVQSMAKREWNLDEITNACIEALKEMDSFDFNTYEAKLKAKGYGVKVTPSRRVTPHTSPHCWGTSEASRHRD